jgi:hypothetical protein
MISVLGNGLLPTTSAISELTLRGAINAALGFLADFFFGAAFFAAFFGAAFLAAFLGAAFLAAAFFGAAFFAAFFGAAFFAAFLAAFARAD